MEPDKIKTPSVMELDSWEGLCPTSADYDSLIEATTAEGVRSAADHIRAGLFYVSYGRWREAFAIFLGVAINYPGRGARIYTRFIEVYQETRRAHLEDQRRSILRLKNTSAFLVLGDLLQSEGQSFPIYFKVTSETEESLVDLLFAEGIPNQSPLSHFAALFGAASSRAIVRRLAQQALFEAFLEEDSDPSKNHHPNL